MKELILELDYMSGPIRKDVFDIQKGELCTGIEVVDSDSSLKIMNEEIQEIYTGFFMFDEDEQAVLFDDDSAKEHKRDLLQKIKELVEYVESINDGSFSVTDYVTEYIGQL